MIIDNPKMIPEPTGQRQQPEDVVGTQIGYQRYVGQEGTNEVAYASSVVPNGGAGSRLQGE
jgi:hypothetical protein